MNFSRIACVVVVACFASAPMCSGQDGCPRPRLISVRGTAEIEVAPDEAVLRFAIDSHDRLLGAAKSQNDERAKNVLAIARAAGVDEKDIKTSALAMSPNYSNEKVPRLIGYDVSQSLVITLHDLSKYETVMTKLLEAGVNRVDNVQFRVGEDRKYRDEARAKAIAAAKEKATAMAGLLGQSVGKPWEVDEEGEPGFFNQSFGANSVAYNALGGKQESTVAPGQVTISASVSVSFQLE